jgi:protein phosphatase slingshot
VKINENRGNSHVLAVARPGRARSIALILVTLTCAAALLLFGLGRMLREKDNYSLIDEGLYLGGDVAEPPPGTKAVINLCEKADPYWCDFQLWEPIRDGEPAPSLDWLRRMVNVIDAKHREGLTVYVHCRNGVSRSGMLVTAYEMHKHNWTRDEALEFVRSKRPIVRPNPAFMRLLHEWEMALEEK